MIDLTTERLHLRNFRPEDWRDLQRLGAGFTASPMRYYDHQWQLDDESMKLSARQWAQNDASIAVERLSDGAFLGLVCLNQSPDARCMADMGYNFLAEAQGQGYAAEACRAVLGYAFDTLGLMEVTAGTAQANLPSRRLLARLGFEKISEGNFSFAKDAQGKPLTFVGYGFSLPRGRYLAQRA